MKKHTLTMVAILLLMLLVAGCGRSGETPSTTSEVPARESETQQEDENTTKEAQEVQTTEEGAYLRLYPPVKPEDDSLVPNENVKSAIIRTGDRFPLSRDGSFSISYSGSLHESEELTIIVEQLTFTGQFDDASGVLGAEKDELVGTGRLTATLLHSYQKWDANTDETNPTESMIEIDCEMEFLAIPFEDFRWVQAKTVIHEKQLESRTTHLSDGTVKEDSFEMDASFSFGLMINGLE